MGAAPTPGRLTIDPDATYIDTYGKNKEGSRFSYKGEVQVSPLVGVVGETGDVLAIRARGGNASPRRKLASFIDECVASIPAEARPLYQLWIRIDSAGFSKKVVETCVAHKAIFTITAEQNAPVREAICALAMAPETSWTPAQDVDGELSGSEVAETTYAFSGRDLRLVVRRQRKATGEQLSFDDLGGWRFFACITNAPASIEAAQIDHHHRLRGGAAEEAIRQLKSDFAMNHAPVQNFFGNWLWWLASALSHNIARWLRVLALPESFATCRGKRLRTSFLNVAAKVVRRGRRLLLRLPAAYRHAEAFIAALARLRMLPRYASTAPTSPHSGRSCARRAIEESQAVPRVHSGRTPEPSATDRARFAGRLGSGKPLLRPPTCLAAISGSDPPKHHQRMREALFLLQCGRVDAFRSTDAPRRGSEVVFTIGLPAATGWPEPRHGRV